MDEALCGVGQMGAAELLQPRDRPRHGGRRRGRAKNPGQVFRRRRRRQNSGLQRRKSAETRQDFQPLDFLRAAGHRRPVAGGGRDQGLLVQTQLPGPQFNRLDWGVFQAIFIPVKYRLEREQVKK